MRGPRSCSGEPLGERGTWGSTTPPDSASQKLVVAISGTPGTGKSAVGIRVARALNAELVELSGLVLERRLYSGYDEERSSFVVDEARLRDELRKLALEKGRLVVVGHYGEVVDDDVLHRIVVLRLDPRELARRLIDRGWPPEKVRENVESELMGVCTSNALAEHPPEKVCEVDVSGRSIDDVADEVVAIILGSKPCRVYVDWLSNEAIIEYVLRLGMRSLI